VAYDAIRAETDPARQLDILNALYIDQGTPGLHAMIRARSYRTTEYIDAINQFPNYFDAVRPNTLRVNDFGDAIAAGASDRRRLYPSGKIVPVYFVIGALRASGTANATAPTDELVARYPHLVSFVAGSPIDNLVALNLHEYIHAQQRSTRGVDLLS